MDARIAEIRQNIEHTQLRIRSAAQRAGRVENAVDLVVVTKTQPVEVIRAAAAAGARVLGENYPDETLPKIQALSDLRDISWHMIGHLQSRKSSIVVEHFQMLQSLDSLKLAERLNRQLEERGAVLPVLLELNVSGEESKYGWHAWEDGQVDALLFDVERLIALGRLDVRGLMTMPPYFENPEQARPFFQRLRRLGEVFAERFGEQHFQQLSMGTSGDFEVAVEEGATMVRIGTAILGPRQYP